MTIVYIYTCKNCGDRTGRCYSDKPVVCRCGQQMERMGTVKEKQKTSRVLPDGQCAAFLGWR